MSQPFYVYTETRKNGESYFYYKLQGPDGRWRKRSTGIVDDGTKKARQEAERFVLRLEQSGDLLPTEEQTLAQFAYYFWTWDNSDYLKARLVRDPKAISPEQANRMEMQMQRRIIPEIGHLKLKAITTDVIDDLVSRQLASGLSSQTVVHMLNALRAPLAEARRLRLIPYNPMSEHMRVTVRSRSRGAISPDEAKLLLDPTTITTVWASRDERMCSQFIRPFSPWKHWAINLLGASTGRRINEILAIHAEDIDWAASTIHVHRSIGALQGLKEGTKTGRGSIIPIAPEILSLVQPLLSTEGFIFQGYTPGKWINYQTVTRKLQQALVRIGVSEVQQKERLLGFHSWRHYFNTRARAAGMSDAAVQAITEHRTITMTDRYTHFEAKDLEGVRAVQLAVLG